MPHYIYYIMKQGVVYVCVLGGCLFVFLGFPSGSVVNPPVSVGGTEKQGRFLGQKDPLEEEMAAHSSILAWRIPQTEEPGGLQSMGREEA